MPQTVSPFTVRASRLIAQANAKPDAKAKDAKTDAKAKDAKAETKAAEPKKAPREPGIVEEFFYIIGEDGKPGEMRCEVSSIVTTCSLLLVCIGSACWAASIASARRHNAVLNFFIGLVVPWIYPIYILLTMKIPGRWDITDPIKEQEKLEQQKIEEKIAEEEAQQKIPIREIPFEPTEEYFNKIARDEEGKPTGPFDVGFMGNKITVTQIIEVLPEAVNVLFYDNKPNIRKMRIPYARIQYWNFID